MEIAAGTGDGEIVNWLHMNSYIEPPTALTVYSFLFLGTLCTRPSTISASVTPTLATFTDLIVTAIRNCDMYFRNLIVK